MSVIIAKENWGKISNQQEGIVTKVGRKYFHVKPEIGGNMKFGLHNFREISDYQPEYRVFLTKQDMDEFAERYILDKNIREAFYLKTNYTLDQLRRIKQIIDE